MTSQPQRNKRTKNGYGNIYTPHAGPMIIQVQREGGLANRTIIIGERQVSLLRMLGSRWGMVLLTTLAATWILFAVQTARVPLLHHRIAQLERENRRIDSLHAALANLQGRYEQVRRMLGVVPQPVTQPVTPSTTPTLTTPQTPAAVPPTTATRPTVGAPDSVRSDSIKR